MPATIDELFADIDAAKLTGDWARAAQLLEAALSDPRLDDQYSRGSVADELVDLYLTHRSAADAEEVVDRAEEHGWFTFPYARMRRAGLKVAAGDLEAANLLYDAALADHDHPVVDVHLLWEAGLVLADVGDDARALDWLAEGIRVSIEQHDAEGLLEEIVEARQAALKTLGREDDAAQRTAATHLRLHARFERPDLVQEQPAVGFFPESEYEHARRVWPDLADVFLESYDAYAAVVEQQLRAIAGTRPVLVPLLVDDFVEWARGHELDAGGAHTRARYAAERADAGDAIPWPPPRNNPCWCGSGSKYKKCHGG